MSIRSLITTGIAAFVACLFASSPALGTVKCDCNRGATVHAMSADYDDDDVEEQWG